MDHSFTSLVLKITLGSNYWILWGYTVLCNSLAKCCTHACVWGKVQHYKKKKKKGNNFLSWYGWYADMLPLVIVLVISVGNALLKSSFTKPCHQSINYSACSWVGQYLLSAIEIPKYFPNFACINMLVFPKPSRVHCWQFSIRFNSMGTPQLIIKLSSFWGWKKLDVDALVWPLGYLCYRYSTQKFLLCARYFNSWKK